MIIIYDPAGMLLRVGLSKFGLRRSGHVIPNTENARTLPNRSNIACLGSIYQIILII